MARRKNEIAGQLSIFDELGNDELGLGAGEDNARVQESEGSDPDRGQSGTFGSVESGLGRGPERVAEPDGDDTVRDDYRGGLGRAVPADADSDGGRPVSGATGVAGGDTSVPGVVGVDRDVEVLPGGSGSGGPDPTGRVRGVAAEPASASVAEVGESGGDRLRVDDSAGSDTDSRTGRTANGQRDGEEEVRADAEPVALSGDPADWTGGTSRPSGFRSRLHANIAALEVLQQVRTEQRYATPAEQATLAGWSSWGALPEVFDPLDERVSAEDRERIRSLLGEDGWTQARATTLNAHYTDPAHARAMWHALQRAGFDQGQVLEPGSGSGEFIGQAPAGAQMTGVELDETTARISALLYPSAEIHATGFESAQLPESGFHATVGNVPFGNFSVPDQAFNAQNHSIHNYFIVKSLRMTAPGGYVAVMTSAWTMDSSRTTARREMARYGDLVGAVRLPSGAMRDSAGTDVTADVMVFRRREPDAEIDQDAVAAWVEPGSITLLDREGDAQQLGFSRYFAEHPENVLGEVQADTGPWGVTYEVRSEDLSLVGEQLESRLADVVDRAGENGLAYAPVGAGVVHEPGLRFPLEAEADVGHVRFNPESNGFERYGAGMQWEPVKVPRARVAEAQSLLRVRDLAVATMVSQSEGHGAEASQQARDRLREAWQRYVDQHGPINRSDEVWKTPPAAEQRARLREFEDEWRAGLPEDGDLDPKDAEVPEALRIEWEQDAGQRVFHSRRQPHLVFLAGDPKLGLLRACESFDEQDQTAEPAALLVRDVIEYRPRPETAETVQDAIAISLEESRTVDPDRVAGLLGIDADTALERMSGAVYRDPETNVLVPAETYLSGDVRAKLDQAREQAAHDDQFRANVVALEAVVPDEVDIRDVVVNPGVQWVPHEIYTDFVRDTFEVACDVKWNPVIEQWEVDSPKGGFNEHVRFQWGTSKRTPANLLAAAMNYRAVVVRYKDIDGVSHKDEKATTAAREKVEAIRKRFNEWVTEDPRRAQLLQDRYNRAFNAHVAPDYAGAGEGLSLPGLAESRTPYAYQRAAVARVVNEPAVLLDHVVGAGKTGTMVMSAMELRRTGIAHKPAIVVPNHLVEQISREFVEWYPATNVLAVPTGLKNQERQEWMAMAAAGDWDAVILPQTVFERVQIDPGKQAEWLRERIDEIEAMGTSVDEDRLSVKRIEASKKRLETQYAKSQRVSDPGITFEQTGIDYLFVDEAHHFKNLARTSDLAELSCAGSMRAMDLDFKLRALREQKILSAQRSGLMSSTYQPSVATFATGTPVSNNMAEMWVMQHYLRPDLLAATNTDTVTAWGQQFTTSETTLKPKITGDGFDQVTRIGRYVNVPELMRLNGSFTDTVLRDQLEASLPEVATGDRILLRREPSEQVLDYIGELSERIENLSGPPEKGGDNMLAITGDGRKVALDPRLVGLDADVDGGRAASVAEQIIDLHERTKHTQYRTETGELSPTPGGLQIVFCDQSTPRDEWNMYDEMRDQLAQRGMDPEAVRFIHDAETDQARQDLFAACRDGQVSVLIGSTGKMGTGTNIQQRAVGLHHVDCPWRPADLEQREGRIIRQGNQNESVEIYSYATENTFDVASWDMIARKARFIGQMKRGALAGREMEDAVADLEFSASRAASELSGDPRIEQLAGMQMRIEQLVSLESSWRSERSQTRMQLRTATARVEYLEGFIPQLEQLAAQVRDTSGDAFQFRTAAGSVLSNREAAGDVMAKALRAEAVRTDQLDFLDPTAPRVVGELGGVELGTVRHANNVYLVATALPAVRRAWPVPKLVAETPSGRGTAQSVEAFLGRIGEDVTERRAEQVKLQAQIPHTKQALEIGFEYADELSRLRSESAELQDEMGMTEAAETEEMSRVLTGQEVQEKLILRHGDLRAGDVWSYKKAYYRLGEFTTDDGAQRILGWPSEEDRPEQINNSMVSEWMLSAEGKLVTREFTQLSEFEQNVVDLDTDHHRHEQHLWGVENGTRLRFETEDHEIKEGVLDSSAIVLDDGTRVTHREYARAGTGFVALNVTNPEEQRAQQEEAVRRERMRNPRQFSPGEVLEEDIEKFGYAGDIVLIGGPMRTARIAVSPDTGIAREQRGIPASGEWKTRAPIMLTGEEKKKLFGAEQFTVQAGELRPGDVVVSTDIDSQAKTKEPVTLTDTGFPSGMVDLGYRGATDSGNGKKKATTKVTVLDRPRAGCTTAELMDLAGHDTTGLTTAQDVFQDPEPGQYVLVEGNDARGEFTAGIVSGELVGTSTRPASDYSGTRIHHDLLQIRDELGNDHFVLASAKNGVVITESPVRFSELQLHSGVEVVQEEASRKFAPEAAAVTGETTAATKPARAPVRTVQESERTVETVQKAVQEGTISLNPPPQQAGPSLS